MPDKFVSDESRFIKFSLLVLLGTVCLICIFYIIYNIITYSVFRRQFYNQTTFILVFMVLLNTIFNIPTTFSFFARGHVLLDSETFCLTWQIIDYIFTANIIWCKAIFTLERYILVFHPQYLRSQKQKLVLHYIPLISISLYLTLFYISINCFGPCGHNKYKYNRHLCGEECLDQGDGLSLFNWIFNILFPVFAVILGSLCLLIRVLWTRRKMQRNLRNWSKNWKMIVQLFGIAAIYTIVWLPVSIISLIPTTDSLTKKRETVADHFYFLTYLCELSVPIIALLCWPELMRRLRRGVHTNSIAPVTMANFSTN